MIVGGWVSQPCSRVGGGGGVPISANWFITSGSP